MKKGTIRFWSKFPGTNEPWDQKAVVMVCDVSEKTVLEQVYALKGKAMALRTPSFKRMLANCGGVIAAELVKELEAPPGAIALDVKTRDESDYTIDVYSLVSTERVEWRVLVGGIEMDGARPVLRLVGESEGTPAPA